MHYLLFVVWQHSNLINKRGKIPTYIKGKEPGTLDMAFTNLITSDNPHQ